MSRARVIGRPLHNSNLMNISPGAAKIVSFLVFNGSALIIQAAVVTFAIIAALRHKLKGLWVLTAGTIVGLVQSVVNFVMSSPLHFVDQDAAMHYRLAGAAYLSFTTMLVALTGWFILAFVRQGNSKRAQ